MQDTNEQYRTDRKLYVIVRGDISPGYQMAQAIHAAVEAAVLTPDKVKTFPVVVCLEARDEEHLLCLAPVNATIFREPDLNDEATAFALWCDGSEFADLPLAGRQLSLAA